MKILSLLLLFASSAFAASFSYTDPNCLSFQLNGTVLSCASFASTTTTTGQGTTTTFTSPTTTTTSTVTTTTQYIPPAPVISCPQAILEYQISFADVGAVKHTELARGRAWAFKFTTDYSGRTGTIGTLAEGYGADRFANISEQKCDFSYTNLDSMNGCADTGLPQTAMAYTLGAQRPMVCQLRPGTTYYVNIRNESASAGDSRHPSLRGIDSCPPGTRCGFSFTLD